MALLLRRSRKVPSDFDLFVSFLTTFCGQSRNKHLVQTITLKLGCIRRSDISLDRMKWVIRICLTSSLHQCQKLASDFDCFVSDKNLCSKSQITSATGNDPQTRQYSLLLYPIRMNGISAIPLFGFIVPSKSKSSFLNTIFS
jgi:hypothetical protein